MTPEQALSILVQLAESALAPKQAHIQGEQAAQVLNDFLTKQSNDSSSIVTAQAVSDQ